MSDLIDKLVGGMINHAHFNIAVCGTPNTSKIGSITKGSLATVTMFAQVIGISLAKEIQELDFISPEYLVNYPFLIIRPYNPSHEASYLLFNDANVGGFRSIARIYGDETVMFERSDMEACLSIANRQEWLKGLIGVGREPTKPASLMLDLRALTRTTSLNNTVAGTILLSWLNDFVFATSPDTALFYQHELMKAPFRVLDKTAQLKRFQTKWRDVEITFEETETRKDDIIETVDMLKVQTLLDSVRSLRVSAVTAHTHYSGYILFGLLAYFRDAYKRNNFFVKTLKIDVETNPMDGIYKVTVWFYYPHAELNAYKLTAIWDERLASDIADKLLDGEFKTITARNGTTFTLETNTDGVVVIAQGKHGEVYRSDVITRRSIPMRFREVRDFIQANWSI